MSAGYGGANFEEQSKTLAQVEPMVVAIAIQRLTINILHDHVGRSFAGNPAVKELGNVRVIQAGENLSFGEKAFAECVPGDVRRNYLQRHGVTKLAIDSLGQINGSHAARA